MVAITFASWPLEGETRTTLSTKEAAYHLNRSQQTLRSWACYEDGPLRPIRINGRLAWPVSELRRVLGVAA
jgi:hypothetical protein